MARKTFMSYDYDNDRTYKNLLLAWNKNNEFDFKIEDHSTDVSVNSDEASPIKRAISRKMGEANYFLVLIGKDTHKSDWVSWEIEKADELNKKLIAVKIDNQYTSPAEIFGKGASWAMSFTLESIKNAVDNA